MCAERKTKTDRLIDAMEKLSNELIWHRHQRYVVPVTLKGTLSGGGSMSENSIQSSDSAEANLRDANHILAAQVASLSQELEAAKAMGAYNRRIAGECEHKLAAVKEAVK